MDIHDFLFVFERGIFALELKGGTVERVNMNGFILEMERKKEKARLTSKRDACRN